MQFKVKFYDPYETLYCQRPDRAAHFFFTSSPLTNQRVPNLTRTQVIMEDYKPLMHVCMIIVNILFSMHFKSRYVQRNVGQI